MVASDDNGNGAKTDGGNGRVRTIIVAGQSSQRTREVLHALRGFTNVVWPNSLESTLAQAQSTDYGLVGGAITGDEAQGPEQTRML